jgi:hypothetical protein
VSSLQTVAMGLVIVFLDAGAGGYDWIADPLGWVLVIMGLTPLKALVPNHRGISVTAWVCLAISVPTWPPSSVAHLDASLGWLFSLPTIAFSFLVCDAVMEVTEQSLAVRLRWLRHTFALTGVLPLLIYGLDLDWLTVPAAVLVVMANVVLVFSLWAAGDDEPDELPLEERLRQQRDRRDT